ncbi:MAG: hypothetical protein SGJ18_15790 [Pseudomonadota bacterium]|nr:hypothetical protein [Pseudomonadota bacterium]
MEIQKNLEESKAAFGVFRTESEVSLAKDELHARGFTESNIAILYPPHRGPQDFPQRQRSLILTGALVGAAIGGPLLMVVSMLVSMGAIPVMALQNLAVFPNQMLLVLGGLISGVVLGAASGALVGIGTPESAGKRYGDYVDSGGILMSVHVSSADEARQAKNVLDSSGAQDVTLLGENQGWETVYSKLLST